jgi:hypothetical protein
MIETEAFATMPVGLPGGPYSVNLNFSISNAGKFGIS